MNNALTPPCSSPDAGLSLCDLERYERQLILPRWGERQQLALAKVSVEIPGSLITGAIYLAAAGVGAVRLSESPVEKTQLAHLRAINPSVNITDCSRESTDSLDTASNELIKAERTQSAGKTQIIIQRKKDDAQTVICKMTIPDEPVDTPSLLRNHLEGIYIASAILRFYALPSKATPK